MTASLDLRRSRRTPRQLRRCEPTIAPCRLPSEPDASRARREGAASVSIFVIDATVELPSAGLARSFVSQLIEITLELSGAA
jgi:hypothetical protein